MCQVEGLDLLLDLALGQNQGSRPKEWRVSDGRLTAGEDGRKSCKFDSDIGEEVTVVRRSGSVGAMLERSTEVLGRGGQDWVGR